MLEPAEIERFLDLAQRLPSLTPAEVRELSIVARPGLLDAVPVPTGIFELGRPSQGAAGGEPDGGAQPGASGTPGTGRAGGGPAGSGPGDGSASWTMRDVTDEDPDAADAASSAGSADPTPAGGN